MIAYDSIDAGIRSRTADAPEQKFPGIDIATVSPIAIAIVDGFVHPRMRTLDKGNIESK